ncbi:MAG: hypothetical protein JWP14_3409, partial [Frankiales bacterium]|nr:hypothetical protein [Frankiales bacterium]
ISFPEETPDALILAACREAVKGARGRIGSGQTVAYKQASGSSEAGEPRD